MDTQDRGDAFLLILDLDETLVFATSLPLERSYDFAAGPYAVYRGPGLEGFLEQAARHFELAVWTSSTAAYAAAVCDEIFASSSPSFVWSRNRCTLRLDPESREDYWLKDLKKVKRLGYALEPVLVVDDSPQKLRRNFGNHVKVAPYLGAADDDELSHLGRYLPTLKSHPDVRTVEKRGWRSKICQGQPSKNRSNAKLGSLP